MANKILDIKLNLTAADNVNGILTLNSVKNQSVTYDDSSVRTNSQSVPSGSATQIIPAVGASTDWVYLYIKNTDTTNFINLKTDAGTVFGKLLPGEFNLISVAVVAGIELQADTAACVIEYAKFPAP